LNAWAANEGYSNTQFPFVASREGTRLHICIRLQVSNIKEIADSLVKVTTR
jgi:hypothetical protein